MSEVGVGSAEALSGTHADPHGIGVHVGRMGTGSRRAGRAALVAAANLLVDGEVVQHIVQGRVLGHDGAAILTDRRLLLVNGREWKPDVVDVPLASGLEVRGWQQDRQASLGFTSGGATHVIDLIREGEMARTFAEAVRARVGS